MKAKPDSGGKRVSEDRTSTTAKRATAAPNRRLSAGDFYALVFGAFLGLCVLKFGDPVILDKNISPPGNWHQAWGYSWPPHWTHWLLIPLILVGFVRAAASKPRWPATRWLWILPLAWFGWQLMSATRTVDAGLTAAVLWQFVGCLACYFSGALLLQGRRPLNWVLVGLLAGFTLCLIRAVNQRLIEYPRERQALLEGERAGWTNFAPALVQELKQQNIIIHTNGVDIANPLIMTKYKEERVSGTMVYPNALAGIVLLLWPLSIVLAFTGSRAFRPPIRVGVIALTLFLGAGGLIWSGSKYGWLLALALGGVCLLRLNWPTRWKYAVVAGVLVVGLVVFFVRFHRYFAKGATSVVARFDYWRAAVEVTEESPLFGSGPGTFQRPYAGLKSPDAEMARLTHNDYLEQFSDSGIIGGISYTAWIILALVWIVRRLWREQDAFRFAVFLGTLGWFVQGLAEFSLYIPALGWTAFTLLGWLVCTKGKPFDKSRLAS